MSVDSGSNNKIRPEKSGAQSSTDDLSSDDEKQLESPGQRLKQAREAMGIAREDVASELRLDLKVIKALEEGDLEHLPEPVFTAGYLRSFARLVGLPADELIKQYVSSETRDLPPVDRGITRLPERYRKVADALPTSFSISSTHHHPSSNVRKQAWLIIGMLLVVLISWQSSRWMEQPSPEEQAGKTSSDATLQTDSSTALTQPDLQAQSANQSSTGGTNAGGVADTTAGITASTNNAATDTVIATAKESSPQAPAQISKSLPLKPVVESAPVAMTGADEPALEQVKLSLRFSENSWVDIRDSTGKRLIRELGFKGAHKQIVGVAPFQVLLGYGPGVELEYNGKPYDFSDYQKAKVARFTLDVADGAGLNISAPSSQPGADPNSENTSEEEAPEIGD